MINYKYMRTRSTMGDLLIQDVRGLVFLAY